MEQQNRLLHSTLLLIGGFEPVRSAFMQRDD